MLTLATANMGNKREKHRSDSWWGFFFFSSVSERETQTKLHSASGDFKIPALSATSEVFLVCED